MTVTKVADLNPVLAALKADIATLMTSLTALHDKIAGLQVANDSLRIAHVRATNINHVLWLVLVWAVLWAGVVTVLLVLG